jgi:hypothetical protein
MKGTAVAMAPPTGGCLQRPPQVGDSSRLLATFASSAITSRRHCATTANAKQSGAGDAGAAGTEKPAGEGATAEGAEKPKEPELGTFAKWREDLRTFPDIYNTANMLNMAIFTIFCLCSTGTEAEGKWWVDFWGVDGAFAPWSWLLHSLLCTNFLAMTFAMILFHALSHATMAQIGSRNLLLFLAVVCSTSGALMYGTNAAFGEQLGLAKEKQFGPWDAIAALMVMQYLAVGMTPWGLLLSYNGWIRYANLVGAVCIVYYDPQPLVWGTLIGLALTKGKVFPPVKPVV